MMSGLQFPSAASTPLASTYQAWSPRALAFIQSCLNLMPSERPSAQSLLADDFFLHDAFPDVFLPELRQKVQQEFSGNALLSKESRQNSGGHSNNNNNSFRRSKRNKDEPLSTEAIYGRSVAHSHHTAKGDHAVRR